MTTVHGGTVSVEDCVKHAGYPDPQFAPTRKVRVELNFSFDEGEDRSGLDTTAALANSKVNELLGKTPASPAPLKLVQAGAPKAATAKDDLAKAAGVDEAAVAAAAKAPPKAGARKTKPEPTSPPAAEVVEEPVVETLASDEFAVAEPAKEITDKDLHDAMSRKNGELKNPVPIRGVVAKYKPANHAGLFQAAEIPQAQRAQFLADLASLKPAAA